MQGLVFTLYDSLAYAIPGAIVVAAFLILNDQVGQGTNLLSAELPDAAYVVLILSGIYVIGHLLQAIANLTIDLLASGGYPPRNYFPHKFERDFQEPLRSRLHQCIVKSFGVQDASPSDSRESVNRTVKDAYWACYLVVAQSKSNSLSQVFNALCSMYRGLCIAGLLIALVYLAGGLWFGNYRLLWVVPLALGASILFFVRIDRFKRYLARTIYSDFLAKELQPPSGETKSKV